MGKASYFDVFATCPRTEREASGDSKLGCLSGVQAEETLRAPQLHPTRDYMSVNKIVPRHLPLFSSQISNSAFAKACCASSNFGESVLVGLPPPSSCGRLQTQRPRPLRPTLEASAPGCSQQPFGAGLQGAAFQAPRRIQLRFRSVPSPAGHGRACTYAHSHTAHTHASSVPAPHPGRRSSAGLGGGGRVGDVRTAVPRRAAGEGCALLAEEAGGALGQQLLPRSSLCTRCHAAGPRGSLASLQVN
jgi:hypothetical protein